MEEAKGNKGMDTQCIVGKGREYLMVGYDMKVGEGLFSKASIVYSKS